MDGTSEEVVEAGVWHLAFCFWQLDVAGGDVAEDVRGAIGYSYGCLVCRDGFRGDIDVDGLGIAIERVADEGGWSGLGKGDACHVGRFAEGIGWNVADGAKDGHTSERRATFEHIRADGSDAAGDDNRLESGLRECGVLDGGKAVVENEFLECGDLVEGEVEDLGHSGRHVVRGLATIHWHVYQSGLASIEEHVVSRLQVSQKPVRDGSILGRRCCPLPSMRQGR